MSGGRCPPPRTPGPLRPAERGNQRTLGLRATAPSRLVCISFAAPRHRAVDRHVMSLSPVHAPEQEPPGQGDDSAPEGTFRKERPSPVQVELHALRRALQREPEWSARLLRLQRPRPVVSLAYVATAWLGRGLFLCLIGWGRLEVVTAALLLWAA